MQSVEHVLINYPLIEHDLASSGDDSQNIWLDVDHAHRGYDIGSSAARQIASGCYKSSGGHQGVLAPGHRRRSGVGGLPHVANPAPAESLRSRDDPKRPVQPPKDGTLLDVELE